MTRIWSKILCPKLSNKKVTKWIERCFGRNASFRSNNSRKKITKSKSFTQENEKNDPAKGKKIPFATTTYYN